MILITEHEVKDPQGNDILDAIATRFGFTGFDKAEAVQTKQEFLQAWILEKILTEASSHITATAGAIAVKDKQDEIDTEIKPELENVKP